MREMCLKMLLMRFLMNAGKSGLVNGKVLAKALDNSDV
jgi:hypothetical protein